MRLFFVICLPQGFPSGIIKRIYGDKPQDLPAPGIEGAGTVVSSGGGILGWLLTGKRVAFHPMKCGSWGEYAVAKAKDCIILQANISLEQGSMLIANPCRSETMGVFSWLVPVMLDM